MQKMLFVAVLLCDFYANCVDIIQIVLILCKLCCFLFKLRGFYANSAVFMQIVLFWCKLWHLSQFTLFCRKWHFCREIRALAGTFGSAIRRLLLLMMSAAETSKNDYVIYGWPLKVNAFCHSFGQKVWKKASTYVWTFFKPGATWKAVWSKMEVVSQLVVKTFSNAAAERLRLIKRQLRLTSD